MPALTIILDGDKSLKDWYDAGHTFIRQDPGPAVRVSLLKGGMASGKHSVGISALLADGRVAVIETSLELFLGAADAFRARVQAEKEGVV
jgi:hypothetical protein